MSARFNPPASRKVCNTFVSGLELGRLMFGCMLLVVVSGIKKRHSRFDMDQYCISARSHGTGAFLDFGTFQSERCLNLHKPHLQRSEISGIPHRKC